MVVRPIWQGLHLAHVLLTVSLLSVPLLAAQQKNDKKSDTQSTFKSRSELVIIPTVVTSGNKAVRGLTKDNFVVEQDGKARSLTVFEAIVPQTKRVVKNPQSDNFTNVGSDNLPRAMTLIVIDGLNTPIGYQEQTRKDVLSYLAKNIAPNELVGVVVMTSKGIRIVHDFTSDTELLMKALATVTGQNNRFNQVSDSAAPQPDVVQAAGQNTPFAQRVATSGTEEPSVDLAAEQLAITVRQMQDYIKGVDQAQTYVTAQTVRQTLEYFQQIAQGLSGYPGRKAVIWASASFPAPFDPLRYNNMELANSYERALKLLANASVAVYPVDVKGLQSSNPGADATLDPYSRAAGVDPGQAYREASRKIDTFRDFAERTGGRPYFDINKITDAFEDVAAESQAYYLLGYYLDAGEQQGWHKLKVKLKNAEGHVHTRNGFFITPVTNDPEVSRKEDLTVASRSPFDYTTLQLTGRFTAVSDSNGKRRVDFQLRVLPSSNVIEEAGGTSINLDFVAIARKFDTTIAGQTMKNVNTKLPEQAVAQIKSEGILYKSALELEPGDYEVRFLVRDNLTGRMGSVLAPLNVK